jgi:hypothetical protein
MNMIRKGRPSLSKADILGHVQFIERTFGLVP